MPLYAQTIIEEPTSAEQMQKLADGVASPEEQPKRFLPGDTVPKDLPGIADLKKSGAVATTKPKEGEE